MSAASFQIEVPDLLLARARRGDLAAFEEMYRLFERPAYTLALRLLGDAENAREVLHDAMLRVIEHIGQYRGDSPFWGWVRRITLNEALMRLRRERGAAIEDGVDCAEVASDAPPPWALADGAQLERALALLPALTRSVLWLYHVEDYTHAEIAELTGKSVSFSKSQVARGTARLRSLLTVAEEAAPWPLTTSLTA